MHLGGPGIAQSLNQLAAGGAPHDRIINHHDPFTSQHIGQGIELDANTDFPHRLGWLNESTTDITVLDQAIGKGNTAKLGITNGRRDTGVRNTDNKIGQDRFLTRQGLTDTHAIAVK